MSRNLGVLISWNPVGLFRTVIGLLYLYIYASNNKMETYCFVSMAAMAMQVCHNVMLYVHCLILFTFLNQSNPVTMDRVLRFILYLSHIYI